MLYISNNTIKLTRGDTAYLTIPIKDANGEDYIMASNDSLTLSVKKRVTDTEYAFQKTIIGDNIFHILPEDTKGLKFGAYKYDIQLLTEDGDVYTIIPVSSFEILEEVTC